MKNQIDPALLRTLLRYEPETGRLYWLERTRDRFTSDGSWRMWNTRYADLEALIVDSGGYNTGTLFGRTTKAHRICWAIHFGEWPGGQIDHIDGDRSNNKIENLRVVTNMENGQNQRRHITNTSGETGVTWDKQYGKWMAYIGFVGRTKFLGRFPDFEDAVAARKQAERHIGYHPNHGRAA